MPSVFGQLNAVSVRDTFPTRAAVRSAGLHRHLQGGISGHPGQGADAIIVSGGYKDDRDYGSWILYTGEGGRDPNTGRQVRDQVMAGGNKGLAVSEAGGLPVRVIRGSKGDPLHSPPTGYRYDGLFSVERHWAEPSSDGPLIYRYELRELATDGPWSGSDTAEEPADPSPNDPPGGNLDPDRRATVLQRVIRNTAVTQYVKALYDYTCQFCGVRLSLTVGAYAEGAHIRPLGGIHGGADTPSNVLCLCPNDHVLFDKGVIFVDAGLNVTEAQSGRVLHRLSIRHDIDSVNIEYHRRTIAGV